jgi:hypothetical protein
MSGFGLEMKKKSRKREGGVKGLQKKIMLRPSSILNPLSLLFLFLFMIVTDRTNSTSHYCPPHIRTGLVERVRPRVAQGARAVKCAFFAPNFAAFPSRHFLFKTVGGARSLLADFFLGGGWGVWEARCTCHVFSRTLHGTCHRWGGYGGFGGNLLGITHM